MEGLKSPYYVYKFTFGPVGRIAIGPILGSFLAVDQDFGIQQSLVGLVFDPDSATVDLRPYCFLLRSSAMLR